MTAHQLLHLFRNANSWLLFIRPSWLWLLFGYFPMGVRASLGFLQAHNLKVAGSNPTPANSVTCTTSAFARGCLSFGPMPNDRSAASSPNSLILRVLPYGTNLTFSMSCLIASLACLMVSGVFSASFRLVILPW